MSVSDPAGDTIFGLLDSFIASPSGARGVELAMRACGQRSEKTAEAYRTRAFDLLSLERIHEDLMADRGRGEGLPPHLAD